MSSDVPSSFPILDVPSVNTAPVTQRMQDLYRRVAAKPDLELVEVTAQTPPTITVRKIGTTTLIPNVIPVGHSGSQLPYTGDFVWIITPQVGSQPIALGVPAPTTPSCKVYAINNLLAANAAFTNLTMDSTNWTEEYDVGPLHDYTTNNSRITAIRPGIYSIQAAVTFQGNGIGTRGVYVNINGVTIKMVWNNTPNGIFDQTVEVNVHKELINGTYVEFGYYQNVGGVIGITAGIGNTYLSVVKMADLG
jgi:hypothetical protein